MSYRLVHPRSMVEHSIVLAQSSEVLNHVETDHAAQ